MSKAVVWHFAKPGGSPLSRSGDRLCLPEYERHGVQWHGSRDILDALVRAPGAHLCRRELLMPRDREGHVRGLDGRQLTDYVDATKVLADFVEHCRQLVEPHCGGPMGARSEWIRIMGLALCAGVDIPPHVAALVASRASARITGEVANQEDWLARRAMGLFP